MKKSVDGVTVEFADNLKAFSQPVAYRCCAMGRTLGYFGEGRGVAPHGARPVNRQGISSCATGPLAAAAPAHASAGGHRARCPVRRRTLCVIMRQLATLTFLTVSAGCMLHAVAGLLADRPCAARSAGGVRGSAAVRWWTVCSRRESPVWFGCSAVGSWLTAVSDFRSAGRE